eukprot:404782-Pyramimonas_sp.AAC.1
MVLWEHEEHEVAYSRLQAFKMSPGEAPDSPDSPGTRPDPPGESRCSLLTPLETYQSSLLGKNVATNSEALVMWGKCSMQDTGAFAVSRRRGV